jgi:Pvc16 N-terminal domain
VSNHLAIATVTASLAQVLQSEVERDVPGSTVTTARPDAANAALGGTRVNLYLYQVTPNAAWRNSDLPTRAHNGRLMQKPRVALDLHYLLTFYGNEAQHEPQRMLGSAVRALHSKPILARELIRTTITSPALPFLALSNLAEDIELVKFTPTSLTLEELSKLWAVFFQTQYTLSVTYQGTVVLIETDETPSTAPPVLDRNIYVVPFRAPVVQEIRLDAPAPGPIVSLSDIVIAGRALRGDVTQINFVSSALPPVVPTEIADTELKVTLPPDLRAGVQGLQVVNQFLMGTPPAPHRGFESNVGPFVLAPIITQPVLPPQTSVDPQTGLITGTITINFTPRVSRPQRVRLFLNEFQAPDTRESFGYVFTAPAENGILPGDDETDTIEFVITDVAAATYLVRVQVDGAESALARDTNNASPTFNQFIGPQVVIA